MEALVTLPLFSSESLPTINLSSKFHLSEPKSRTPFLHFPQVPNFSEQRKTRSSTRLYAAGLSEIEPDLNEDFVDRWRTNGVEPEDFEYGKWDGAHTYFETEETGLSFLPLCQAFEMNILTTTNTLSGQLVSFSSSKQQSHRSVLAHGNPSNGNSPTKSASEEDLSTNLKFLASVGVLTATNLLVPSAGHAMNSEMMLNATPSLYDLSNGGIGDWFGGFLYSAGQQANEAVQDQLSALSFTSLAVIFGAGLVTSLSPCTLSVLPLTLGYIGAFGSGKSKTGAIGNSIAFALGLATTLALLGVGASFAGKAYGQIGQGLPIAASGLSIVMGLNLLEIIEIQLPSLFSNFDPRAAAANFPSSVQAYLAGLTFALAASPCSTPVLATLLAYVASSRDPIVGGSLLLTYTTGYVAPLLLAASFAGALQSLLSFRKFSAWINPMSGALLLGGGVYTMLDRLFPLTTMSMSM